MDLQGWGGAEHSSPETLLKTGATICERLLWTWETEAASWVA